MVRWLFMVDGGAALSCECLGIFFGVLNQSEVLSQLLHIQDICLVPFTRTKLCNGTV